MAGDELIPAVARLLTARNQRAIDLDEVQEQRISFAYGNGNIDGEGFSRATMSVVVPAITDVGGTNIGATFTPNSVTHRHEAEGAVRQFDATLDLIRRFTEPGAPKFMLDPSIIEVLHSALLTRGDTGGIRTEEVTIRGSNFGPPAPNLLRRELDSMCDVINSEWGTLDALELAAFALWRLNWIHPFVDGNGRTARALSYLVLNIKLGGVLPGTPTIPEQLLHRRAEYLDALARADITAKSGHVDLTNLRDLVGSMLQRQLEAFPAFAADELHQIDDIVERRLRGGRNAVASSVFGDDVMQRLWTIDDYVVLQLGPEAAIADAERRHREHDNAFPRLLASHSSRAVVQVGAHQRGIILRDQFSLSGEQFALGLEHNAAATVEHPVVRWEEASTAQGWSAVGALYILRFGRELTSSTAGDVFDLLLTRHLASLKS
ncbi:Fic family protein [Methylobacterium sp. J-048]|uniref:Fic family protein n=1 Tax=Methylobacterium sp. J-048 TaxID=2836635 RepID=UPI001FBA0B23|nr:Fic family protein [Methylobacterium sp. J-048]MCJ2061034.1 Fic family protein [Methylobacterium sp. J-048]